MIKVQRMGHATIETPDFQKSLDYFVNLNGFVVAHQDRTAAHLATKIGQLNLTLQQSDNADCTRLSFEVAPDSDFREMARFLSAQGITSEIRKDPFPGTPEILTFNDAKGTAIDLFKQWDFLTGNQNVAGIGPLKVGHIAFFTPDVQGMVKF